MERNHHLLSYILLNSRSIHFFSPSDGLAAFRSFLQSEFSDENIEFWTACEDFKKTKNPVKMAAKAKKIYEDFIQSEGPREVRNSLTCPLFCVECFYE